MAKPGLCESWALHLEFSSGETSGTQTGGSTGKGWCYQGKGMVGAVAGQPRSPQLQCNTLIDIPLTLCHTWGPSLVQEIPCCADVSHPPSTSHPHPAPSCSGPRLAYLSLSAGRRWEGARSQRQMRWPWANCLCVTTPLWGSLHVSFCVPDIAPSPHPFRPRDGDCSTTTNRVITLSSASQQPPTPLSRGPL